MRAVDDVRARLDTDICTLTAVPVRSISPLPNAEAANGLRCGLH